MMSIIYKVPTVACEGCDQLMLAPDAEDTLTDVYCAECTKKRDELDITVAYVKQSLEEVDRIHTIFSEEDIRKLPPKMQQNLSSISKEIQRLRIASGRNPLPQYIVSEIDENPHLAKEIIDIQKRHRAWRNS